MPWPHADTTPLPGGLTVPFHTGGWSIPRGPAEDRDGWPHRAAAIKHPHPRAHAPPSPLRAHFHGAHADTRLSFVIPNLKIASYREVTPSFDGGGHKTTTKHPKHTKGQISHGLGRREGKRQDGQA